MARNLEIRNSTAEFLTFVAEGKEQGVQVLYKDETVWATQKAMAALFDCSADNVGLHLRNIYETDTEKISVVQMEGEREVRRNTLFYSLDSIISVGYRVNSIRATQFRQWCTQVIRQFSLCGYNDTQIGSAFLVCGYGIVRDTKPAISTPGLVRVLRRQTRVRCRAHSSTPGDELEYIGGRTRVCPGTYSSLSAEHSIASAENFLFGADRRWGRGLCLAREFYICSWKRISDMKIKRIDHLVVTTRDLRQCLDFYVGLLGMEHRTQDGHHSLYFREGKISLHTARGEFAPSADNPEYGAQDFCLVVEDDLAALKTQLVARGADVVEGIVERHGAMGKMQSLYLRDPDGNLLELCRY